MLWTAAVNLNVKVIKIEVQSGLSGRHCCLDTGRDCCLTSAVSVPQHHSHPGAKSMKLNENSTMPVNKSRAQNRNLNSMWHLTCKSQFPVKSINPNFLSLLRNNGLHLTSAIHHVSLQPVWCKKSMWFM